MTNQQTLYEFGGEGDLIHLAVANGFPPQTYIPMIRHLTGQYRVVSLPPRPLWSDEPPPQKMMPWRDTVGADLLKGIEHYDLRDIIAVGHSFGGVATLVAAEQAPERFKALVILDPPILPPWTLLRMRFQRMFGKEASNGLESMARRRRDTFDSIDAAYENFVGKGIFGQWPDETVHLYAETMRPTADGRVQLAWAKEWEAYYFRTWILYLKVWGDMRKLKPDLPIFLIRGGTSDTFADVSGNMMAMLFPNITYEELPDHGHLFPHSAPDATAEMIVNWLNNAGLS